MAVPDWRVVVVRAWRDGEDLRVRILSTGPGTSNWTVVGAGAAARVLWRILGELDPEEAKRTRQLTDDDMPGATSE